MPSLLDSLISVAASATIMAYSLYTFTSPKLPHNNLMMLTIPLVIFGCSATRTSPTAKTPAAAPRMSFCATSP